MNTPVMCEIWGFYSGADSSRVLLGCGAMLLCRIPTFQRGHAASIFRVKWNFSFLWWQRFKFSKIWGFHSSENSSWM